jgi:hypothetical protein
VSTPNKPDVVELVGTTSAGTPWVVWLAAFLVAAVVIAVAVRRSDDLTDGAREPGHAVDRPSR